MAQTIAFVLLSFSCILYLCSAAMALNETSKTFNITAISAVNGKSTIECWQLDAPTQVSSSAGTAGAVSQQLGDVSNATYTVLPSRFDGGLHNAPMLQ